VYGEIEKSFSILKVKKMRKEKRKELNFMEFKNTEKYILATLISLMLISSFAASGVVTVQALDESHPWDDITLHATITVNPYWGYYGGYHDIWQAIKTEVAKIGINLEIHYYTDFVWYDRVWTDGNWDQRWTGDGGWDLTIFEWWLQPHALEPWFSSMLYSWLQPQYTEEEGFNVHPWNNSKADELLEKAMTSFDAETRKFYIDKWQEVFMHDAPWINLYYPRIYETMGKWLEGYEPTGVWWYDVSQLKLNTGLMPTARQALHQDWVYYAVTEDIWSLLPPYMDTYTEEQMEVLQWSSLYSWSMNWDNFVTGTQPDPTDYIISANLADGFPTQIGPLQYRVNLKQGVKWSDGDQFDADDVVMTLNNITLNKLSGNTGIGDWVWWLKNATKVGTYQVDLHLKRQVADLLSLLANDWGGLIMPHHIFKDVAPQNIEQRDENINFDDPTAWAPVTGPFKLKEIVAGEYCLLERNPLYFGFDENVMGVGQTWGPDPSVQAIYLKTVPDPAVRLLEFQTYRLDLGEYPTAPLEVWQVMEDDPYLNVFQYDYPASNPIWINFNNPYLSNRWIRKAIGHAIPYPKIFSEILPSWGIETAYPGKTYVMPVHYYTEPNTGGDLVGTTVHLFNEELEPWYYDIELAEDYMELWWYSENNPAANGPQGDADFSGLVDLDDFLILRDNAGVTADWPVEVVPGNMIDPDFDNSGTPSMIDDFDIWGALYGVEY